MPVNAIALANTILSIGFVLNIPITHAKLEYLSYLTYALYLQYTTHPLFKEPFQVRPYGPYLKSVRNAFLHNMGQPIKDYHKNQNGTIECIDAKNSPAIRHVLADITVIYMPMSVQQLNVIVTDSKTACGLAIKNGKTELTDDDIRLETCIDTIL